MTAQSGVSATGHGSAQYPSDIGSGLELLFERGDNCIKLFIENLPGRVERKNRVCRRLDVGKYLNCTAACAGVLRDDTWNCEVPAQQADLTSSSSSFRLIVRQPSPHKFMSHQISNKIFERFRKCRANDDDGVRFDDEDDETFSSTPRLIKTPL